MQLCKAGLFKGTTCKMVRLQNVKGKIKDQVYQIKWVARALKEKVVDDVKQTCVTF